LLPLLTASTAVADPDRGPEGVEVNPEPRAPPSCGCEISTPRVLTVRGTVRLKSTAELAAGATVVISSAGAKEAFTAITDERGAFEIALQAGTYDITIYYLEVTLVAVAHRLIVDDLELPPILLDDTDPATFTCWYIGPHVLPPELTSLPRFGATISRPLRPIARDRTHLAWIAPVALADPTRAVTTVEDGRRFTRAPGIPAMFVEEVTTSSLDVPIGQAQGSGGASAVALRYGTNQLRAEARFVGGVDAGAAGSATTETVIGGPIAKDHLWIAGGLVARRDGGALATDGMVRLDAKGDGHDVMLAGLAHDDGDTRAGWSAARWKRRVLDAKLELDATATAELLALPLATAARSISPSPTARRLDRAGAGGSARLHFHGHGHHTATATASAGIGERDGIRHTDASYALGDDWWISSHWTVIAGVRLEQRGFGDARTRVVAPRATVKWDPTGEARGEVFVAYQRVPLLDEGLPGDWKSLAATSIDELIAGVSYRRLRGDTMVGIAAHQRDERTGGDAWLRRETARSVVHLQATSLDRVATLLAQHKLRDRAGTLVTAGASARVGEDRSEGGVALGLKRSPSRGELTAEVAGEAYAGTDGPGGRIVVGILW